MKHKTKISLAILTAVVLPLQLMAVDFGVAGSISAWKLSDSKSASGVDDLRLKISESINDSVKANIVTNIKSGLSIKEGYLAFSKPLDTLGIGHDIQGLDLTAGQKLVSFGLDNTRYTEDRAFIGRSMAVSGLLGDGLVGKGLEVGYTLPIAMPIRLSAGYQQDLIMAATDGTLTEDRSKATTVRAALKQESYTVGVSSLMTSPTSGDKDTFIGVDGSYRHDLGMGTLKVEGEFVNYSSNDKSVESRTGYYVYGGYDWKNSWTTGVVLDSLSKETTSMTNYSAVGLVVSRTLSDSAKLRLQYLSNNNTTDKSKISAQVVFNLK